MTPLRQRMIEDLQIRNYAPGTIENYIFEVAKFARYFGKSPEHLGPEEIRAYQIHLVHERGLSHSTLKIVVAALRFLYRVTLGRDWAIEAIPYPRVEKRLPVVLSKEEVARLLGSVKNLKHRAILTTLYACGLRPAEAVNLQVTDIDSQRMVVRVEQGKGKKDRYVMLSPNLLDLLREYWRAYRPRTYLFPGRDPGRALGTGSVQAACRRARQRAGLRKPATPRSLRHGFATHALESGTSIRTVQVLLGHRSIRTTQIYTHVAMDQIRATVSPLDQLPELTD